MVMPSDLIRSETTNRLPATSIVLMLAVAWSWCDVPRTCLRLTAVRSLRTIDAGRTSSRRNGLGRHSIVGVHGNIRYLILFFSHPQSKGWPHYGRNFLQLSLSCAVLIDSSTGSSIHILIISIQAMCGLPRLRVPGIVPCTVSFSRQLPCFLMV